MSEAFLSQIELFPFDYAPRNWALCAGQTLPINQNQALFALLGTTYGGNGTSTFMLPDLRGRLAVGEGTGPGLSPYVLGQAGGSEGYALTQAEMPAAPAHQHTIYAYANGTSNGVPTPGPGVGLGTGYIAETGTPQVQFYSTSAPAANMVSTTTAGGAPHENRRPFTVLNYCICMNGIFPSRN